MRNEYSLLIKQSAASVFTDSWWDLEWADGLHPWRCLIEAEADWINWKTTREVILSGPCPFEGWHSSSARQIATCFNQPLALDYAWAVTPKIGKKSKRPRHSPGGFTTLCRGNNCFPFPSGWSVTHPDTLHFSLGRICILYWRYFWFSLVNVILL